MQGWVKTIPSQNRNKEILHNNACCPSLMYFVSSIRSSNTRFNSKDRTDWTVHGWSICSYLNEWLVLLRHDLIGWIRPCVLRYFDWHQPWQVHFGFMCFRKIHIVCKTVWQVTYQISKQEGPEGPGSLTWGKGQRSQWSHLQRTTNVVHQILVEDL